MNQNLLLTTINYLSKKQNPDEEDLKNEKRAWSELVALGIKEKEEIPERAREKVASKSRAEGKSGVKSGVRKSKPTAKVAKKASNRKAANPE